MTEVNIKRNRCDAV